MYIAAFDIGSTEAKGLLIDARGQVIRHASVAYPTDTREGIVEQAPLDWWESVCRMLHGFWADGISPDQVQALVMTGQMQDVIAVDASDMPVCPAILYADARAVDEAQAAAQVLASHGVNASAFPHLDGTAPLAKWLWLLRHEPRRTRNIARLLFNAKDYIVLRLTGVAVTDATTAATTSLFDTSKLVWQMDWLEWLALNPAWLPDVRAAASIVGSVTAEGAAATGLRVGTAVLTGCGDAAATTMAAGLTGPGDTYIYLGTTGWAATLSADFGPERDGHFSLPYTIGGTYVDIAPVLNAGTAHQWIGQLIEGRTRLADSPVEYQALDALLSDTPLRSEGVFFLPYLNGERCPVQDHRSLGSFLFLSPNSGHGQLAWAVLEGVAFAIRQVLDTMPPISPAGPIRAIGGMTRSPHICQLLADVLGRDVQIVNNAAHASALATAALAAPQAGWYPSVDDAVAAWFQSADPYRCRFTPDGDRVAAYAAAYQRFVRIYPAIAHI